MMTEIFAQGDLLLERVPDASRAKDSGLTPAKSPQRFSPNEPEF
jgi:hypothetical protein